MAGGKKIEGADYALLAAVYGLGGSVPTYDQFVQLWLNADDVDARRAFYAAAAARVGAGDRMPDEWITAAFRDSPVEASRWRRYDLRRQNP